MSYNNETTYYGLPLPTGSDKSTFTDNNTAFAAVDAALHTAYEGAAQAALDITSLTGRVGDAETNITNLTTDLGLEKAKIVNLQNKETLQDGEIADVRKDAEDMICAYNEATATSTHAYSAGDYFIYNDVLYVATDTIGVGDTIVPDTNCATTNVVTQLAANAGAVGDLTSLTTTDKTSAVAAINEVNTALSTLKNNVSLKTLSVTADGVKTRAELFNELHTAFINAGYHIHADSYISFQGNLYKYSGYNDTLGMMFDSVIIGGTQITNASINLKSNSSSTFVWVITTASTTENDRGSDVPADGTTITLHCTE